MKSYPSLPSLTEAPSDLLERGHLWLQELIAGDLLRFTVDASGWIVFGDRESVYRDDEIPLAYRYAVRHVRETINRHTLQETDGLDEVVFFGVSTHYRTVDYDWDRLPPFVGFDVWADERGWLPPDIVEHVFDRLDLAPVNAFEKEVPARHFAPDSYEIPVSHWYDGPALGVVIRNKRGERAKLSNPRFVPDVIDVSDDKDPATMAAEYITADRVERHLDEWETGVSVDYEAVQRIVDAIVREEYANLFGVDRPVETQPIVQAIESRVRELLVNVGYDLRSNA